MKRPVSVYLDQCAYGQFLNESPTAWQNASVAKVLIHARDTNSALVWASPTNVLETLQSTGRRRELASIILSLTQAKRMWEGHEYTRVHDFLRFFDLMAPGFWQEKRYFSHHVEVARRAWIGALALLACHEEMDLAFLISTARRNKLVSSLLHARFAADPDAFVVHVRESVEGLKTTTADPFEEIKKLSDSEIETEIAGLEKQFKRFSKDKLASLRKNRREWAGAFGAIEIGRMLQSICSLPLELVMALDVRPVVKNWKIIKEKLGCRSLPKECAMAADSDLRTEIKLIQQILQELVYAATKAPLLSSAVGYEVIFRELQRCINDLTLPSGGLAFDADHAVSMCRFEIIVSNDKILTDSIKTLIPHVSQQTRGKWAPMVVTSAGELSKAIEKQAAMLSALQPDEQEAL